MVSAPSKRRSRRAVAAAERRAARGGRPAPLILALIVLGVVVTLIVGALAVRAWLTDPLARGISAMQARDWRSARVDLMTAVASLPQSRGRRLLLADTLIALGRGREAEAQLTYLAELGVPAGDVRARIAEVQAMQGKDADALATLAAGPVPVRDAARAARTAAEANYRLGNFAAAEAAFGAAMLANDRDPATWIAQARWRLSEEDMLGADMAASRAVEIAPGDVRAHMLKALVVRTRGGPVPALPWFEAALAVNRRDAPTLIEYAATLGEAGRYPAMLDVLARARDVDADNPRLLFLQAVVAARGGEAALARGYLLRIGGGDANLPAVLLLRASVEVMLGTPTAAIPFADRLVAMQPDNDRARRVLAAALAAADNPRGAIIALDPITTRGDADSWSLILLGRSFGALDAQADAAQPIDRAMTLSPGDAPPLNGAVDTGVANDARATVAAIRARIAAGDPAGAEVVAAILVAANPGVQQARLLLGDARLASGNAVGALADYRAAAELRFDEPVMLRLVNILSRGGDRTAAGQTITAFIARYPENIAAMQIAGAWAAEGGDWARARAVLRAVLDRAGPNDALVLTQLARAEIEDGAADAALPHAARAYRLMPGNATVSGVYGLAVLRSGGSRRTARELLNKAVGLAPGDALLRRWLREALRAP